MKKLSVLGYSIILLTSVCLEARVVELKSDAVSWKLEKYIPGGVVVWYTSSSCANGSISFNSKATEEDKNKFWSVVMTAKVSSRQMFVRYETNGCIIKSFGLY